MNATGNFSNGEIDLLGLTAETIYLHIAIVDNANNVSETTTLNMDDIIVLVSMQVIFLTQSTQKKTHQM